MTANGQRSIAFALGGIGGSNAHGVGFLHAAAKEGIRPTYLSCTSGMIYWTWRWLEDCDLEQEFTNSANEPWRGLARTSAVDAPILASLSVRRRGRLPSAIPGISPVFSRWYRTPPERW